MRVEALLSQVQERINWCVKTGTTPATNPSWVRHVAAATGVDPLVVEQQFALAVDSHEIPAPGHDPMPTANECDTAPAQSPRAAARPRAITERELRMVPVPEWEHAGWTQRGGSTLIVGAPGSYKTVLLANLLGASSTGNAIFGDVRAMRRGAVYAIVGEDLAGWNKRWWAWRTASGIPENVELPLHTFVEPLNLFTGEGFDDLLADVEAVNPIVIGLDPLSDLISGAEENSARDMGLVRERLKRLKGAGRSLLVCQHTGWDETRERGSSVFAALADTTIVLKAHDRGEVAVRCRKQRNGARFAPMTLQFDPDTHALRVGTVERASATSVPGGGLRDEVLAWVSDNPDQSTDTVAKGVAKRKESVTHILQSLESAGLITKAKRGNATTWRAR